MLGTEVKVIELGGAGGWPMMQVEEYSIAPCGPLVRGVFPWVAYDCFGEEITGRVTLDVAVAEVAARLARCRVLVHCMAQGIDGR